jgi:acetoin utilization deacetylase AcuC-like enzyme
MSRRLYYCDHHEIPLPPGHRFPLRKYRMVRERLAESGFEFEQAPLADAATITLAHDPGYVRGFLEGTLPPAVMRRIGFPWSEGLTLRTLASLGGTLGATADALATGWGGNLAGGTHHAFRGEGSGFCVFNDIAVAILWLRYRGLVSRTAVLDLDVHQGDGTAQLFENDDSVLTISVHGRHNFPFRKQHSRIDVDLADGTGDEEYLAVVEKVLVRLLEFAPEIIFYQSGVDALATDRLGRLSLTPAGLAARDLLVMRTVRESGVPFVVTLGGGYSEPIELTADAHAITFRTARAILEPDVTGFPASAPSCPPNLDHLGPSS